MAKPFIRSYDALRDLEPCLHVFYTTLHEGVNFEPARLIGSYIWCRAYTTLTPDTCFVLDDGSGRAVGYILGTPSTTDFAKRWKEELVPVLDPNLLPPTVRGGEEDPNEQKEASWLKKALYNAECSMLLSKPELLARYPAHLHIDILPEYQSKGWGPQLMDKFLTRVKERGAFGVHLGMVKSNVGARKFYERLGFQLCKEVLDDGKSGEVGQEGDAICMLKEI